MEEFSLTSAHTDIPVLYHLKLLNVSSSELIPQFVSSFVQGLYSYWALYNADDKVSTY